MKRSLPEAWLQMNDEYRLDRFVAAQAPVFNSVLDELRHGRKRTHWMWFVFPQLAGLGQSATARHFAITGLDEARAYLAHPVLGTRLMFCTRLVLAIPGGDAHDIFGTPDDMKFRSCMTLFSRADGGQTVFADALQQYFESEADARTLHLLNCQAAP